MTCCIIGFLVLTAFGRVRRALGRTGPTPMLFAPVARRPAPGQTLVIPAITEATAHPLAVFRYAALGCALGLCGPPVLVWAGAAQNSGSLWMWLLRTTLYLLTFAAALSMSRSVTLRSTPRGPGALLLVVGAVIFELGVLDMHVFGLYDFEANRLWDFTFHAAGPALAIAGGLLLYGSRGRSITSRRSSRSTVRSAVPS